jgi:hypothetical protein
VVFTINVTGNSGTPLADATVTTSSITGINTPGALTGTGNAYSLAYDASIHTGDSTPFDTATKDDIEKALKSMVEGATPSNAKEIASQFDKDKKLGELSSRSQEINRAFNEPNNPNFPNKDYFAVDMSND